MLKSAVYISPSVSIPAREISLTFSRAGGPGGQNVNKVNSKVTLHWNVQASSALHDAAKQRLLARFSNRINSAGELVINCSSSRDQKNNIDECIDKLRQIVRAALHTQRKRVATKPTRASAERRISEKKNRGKTKAARGRLKRDADY